VLTVHNTSKPFKSEKAKFTTNHRINGIAWEERISGKSMRKSGAMVIMIEQLKK
jgi:hypothetical protein